MILLYAHIGQLRLTIAADDIRHCSHSDIESQVEKNQCIQCYCKEQMIPRTQLTGRYCFVPLYDVPDTV